jgi:hypothetical protein
MDPLLMQDLRIRRVNLKETSRIAKKKTVLIADL